MSKVIMLYKGEEVRLMAQAEGWSMVRHHGCMPFAVMSKELSQPTKRAADASPVERCEHGNMRDQCYVEVCSFSKYGERR